MAILYPKLSEIQTTIDNCSDGDLIYLPNDLIDFQLKITKNCMIFGQGSGINKTKIDLSNIDQTAFTNKSCILLQNCSVTISNVSVINKYEIDHIGIEVFQSSLNLDESSSSAFIPIKYTSCISGVNDGCSFFDGKNGIEINDSYGLEFTNTEIYKCENGIMFAGSSSIVGDTTDPESLRKDRVHDIIFESSNIFKCQNGIILVNSDHISFDSSKIYDCSSTAITQLVNSYSNKFRGEIFNIGSYGIKNSDPQAGVHVFDASETWWGDSTGPCGMGKGRGVKISKNVVFEPWLRTGTEPDLSYPATRRWIWNMLGYPQVKVELTEEDVTDCINMALDKYLYYITPDLDYYYLDGASGVYEYKLPPSIPKSSIVEVIYQPNSDIIADLSGSGESFFLTYYMQGSGDTYLSDFYVAMAYKETLERTLGISPTYEFLSRINSSGEVEEYLRIYPRPDKALKIGIKYNRMISEIEVDGTTWVKKYALTWAKEKLGRVRSKYSSIPGPTGDLQMDGSTLLSEVATERQALIEEIISLGEPLGFSNG